MPYYTPLCSPGQACSFRIEEGEIPYGAAAVPRAKTTRPLLFTLYLRADVVLALLTAQGIAWL